MNKPFDVKQVAQQNGCQPPQVRRWLKVLEIPEPSARLPHHWRMLDMVLNRKYPVTRVEVSARVLLRYLLGRGHYHRGWVGVSMGNGGSDSHFSNAPAFKLPSNSIGAIRSF